MAASHTDGKHFNQSIANLTKQTFRLSGEEQVSSLTFPGEEAKKRYANGVTPLTFSSLLLERILRIFNLPIFRKKHSLNGSNEQSRSVHRLFVKIPHGGSLKEPSEFEIGSYNFLQLNKIKSFIPAKRSFKLIYSKQFSI